MPNFLKRWFKTSSDIKDLPSILNVEDLKGKTVLLRASLNVPIKNGEVVECFRIESALETIKFLQNAEAKVVLIGHIGREPIETLEPVHRVLTTLVGSKWGGVISGAKEQLSSLQNGEVILFQNLRQDQREEDNDDVFAKELASLADIYVNDAFADSHRKHASIVGVPKYLPSYFGASFIKEYKALSTVMEPKRPSLFIIGGAKFDTKLPLILRYAKEYDQVFIGGALANDLFRARGLPVGQSLVSDIDLKDSELLSCQNIILPESVVVDGLAGKLEKDISEVNADEKILDAGRKSLESIKDLVKTASTILWNGPLGNYEMGFASGTETLAKMIAESGAYSVVGGGDTIASIRSLGLSDKFSFLSTAGGAMLTFLETGTLPAIDAVLRSPKD